jgi:hypothetical protein
MFKLNFGEGLRLGHATQDRDQWRNLVNLRLAQKAVNFTVGA